MDRILHAGFHKTGSTFLQKRVFPNLEDVEYVGNFSLSAIGSLDFTKPLLFSSEASCGYPYPFTHEFSLEHLEKNAKVLGVNKIILVRREFYSWCLSLYFQTLNEKHSWSLEDFLKVNGKNLSTWKDADKKIEKWCKKNDLQVMIIDYDDLVAFPDKIIFQMADFSGVESVKFRVSEDKDNTSRYGVVTILVYRFLNFVCRSKLVYGVLRLFGFTPRQLVQGKMGNLFEKISPKKWSPSDVSRVIE